MRWNYWLAICLILLGGGILGFTLLFQQTTTSTVATTLADGTQVHLAARVVDRGWVNDQNQFSLKLITGSNSTESTHLQLGARLEIGDVSLVPQGTVIHSLQAGDSATFDWQVQAYKTGSTPGILWVYQVAANGEDTAIYAKEFTFSAYNYLGLSPLLARLLAGGFCLLGLFLIWFARLQRKRNLIVKPGQKMKSN